MAEKRDSLKAQSRLVAAKSSLGRSNVTRLEVLPSNFVLLAKELKREHEASGDPRDGLRPEHFMAMRSPEGRIELMLLLDSIAGGRRIQLRAEWNAKDGVEVPRPSSIWPGLRKLEAEMSDLQGVHWVGGHATLAWVNGPEVEFLPPDARDALFGKTDAKGGTA